MKIKGVRKRRKKTYFGRGNTVSVSRPYVNKRNRLMLGEGEKKRRRRKTVSKQKSSFIGLIVSALAPTAIDLVTKLMR